MRPRWRHTAGLLVLLLVAAACGDDDTATTIDGTSTTLATTTTAAPTTTIDPDPFAGFLTAPVEDPLLGSGFHTMVYVDDDRAYLVSTDSITGSGPDVERLAIGPLQSDPVVTGVAADQMLVAVWVDNWAGEPMPNGVSLYTRGASGWTAYATLHSDEVMTFLETTTDYRARRPAGTPLPWLGVTRFDWMGGTARVTAGVEVFSSTNLEASAPAFEGQIECTIAAELTCVLLSDDGVLRPGDEGDEVTGLQEDLVAIGYLVTPATGIYDDATTDAVREFQRDHRLARDGKAGPQTLGLLERVVDGSANIVMVSRIGIGTTLMNTNAPQAILGLQGRFGTPDDDSGWYFNECDGRQWRTMTWDGFTAIFTDHGDIARLNGWRIDDLGDLPSWLYVKGGFRSGTTWAYVKNLPGADFDPDDGGFFRVTSLEFVGGFAMPPPYPSHPSDSAVVLRLGVGTGAFTSC